MREVVVTGERLPRLLSDTASSVTVVTGDTLEALAGVDRVEQVLSQVPNVQLGSGGEGPTIRGQDSTGVLRDLPAFLGGTRPRVTLQVDGRAVSFNEFVFGLASVWDVERIEVFRSPQTTTQGRNSIGGAIFINTRDPQYDWEKRVRLQGASHDTWQASVAVSGPVVDDQVAFRIAGDLRRSRTSSRITDLVDGADPNEDNYGLVRLKLLAEPTALPGARIETSFVHVDSKMPQVEGIVAPFEARRDPSPIYGVFSSIVDSITSVVGYELAKGLQSTTTLSYGDASITRFAPTGLGQSQTESTDMSVESVIAWAPASAASLLGGVYHLSSRLDQYINLSAVLGEGEFTDRQTSLGVFSEMTLRPWPHVAATIGVRYERDGQDREGLLGKVGLGVPIDFDETFDAWLPKFSVTYEVNRALKAGALIQRAFNPGGATVNFDTGAQDEFAAESLWNYELFLRTSFAEGRATLDANLFFNDFTGAQRARTRAYTVPGGATAFWSEIDNVPAAESFGAEMQLAWLVSSRLVLRAAMGMLETRIRAHASPAGPIGSREFQRAPALTASAAVDWQLTRQWALSMQGRHNSAYFTDDANTPLLRVGGTTVLDARGSFNIGPWSVFAYARNALDRFYLTTFFSPTRATAGDPREVGFGIEARF